MKARLAGMESARLAACVALAAMGRMCAAAIVPVSPADGALQPLLPDAQKKVMALPTQAERRALLEGESASAKALRHDTGWRKSVPLVLKWRPTSGEKGPWEVKLSTRADFSDARTEVSSRNLATNADGIVVYEVPRANLELGTTYYWRVTSGVKCPVWEHGRRCACTNRQPECVSPVVSFVTEDMPPRWIEVEGRVKNIRDVGGWPAAGGRRVKPGLVFRGQGLNDNSEDGITRARNRLMVEDVNYLRNTLGIRTDLDLRSPRELAGMTVSPLGAGVNLVWNSSECYAAVFGEKGKRAMAANFRVFSDRANYPIYFHCIAGADRTGALAYMLNGLLGVSEHDLEVDWESTFYPRIPGKDRSASNWIGHLREGLAKYGAPGDTLSRRIELYLKDCGVTDAEIASVRGIMLGE